MTVRWIPIVALAASAFACGGSGYSNGSTAGATSPTPTPGPTANTTVSIVGQRGDQSFSPNPAPIDSGTLVAWRNADGVTHRIVMNDGSFDSGDITPGGVSSTMRLTGTGGNYHCVIHPTTMFGSINVATTAPPPGGAGY